MERRAFLGTLAGSLLGTSLSVQAQLVINRTTAKALALTIPPSFLERADQVIE